MKGTTDRQRTTALKGRQTTNDTGTNGADKETQKHRLGLAVVAERGATTTMGANEVAPIAAAATP